MEELLRVDHLVTELARKGGGVRLLDDVSFAVPAGEAFGLVGESGSGKSMTCRSILRILQPPVSTTSGSVRFEGRELLSLSERDFRPIRGAGISMIFQDPMTSLNPVLTIGDQLTEVLPDSGGPNARNERAVELLRRVGIPSPEARLKEYPHQFSGGMRQRAMIAIAIAREPKLLLADEPTTALDVTIQAQVLELLDKLRSETGMGMVLVSHDLGVISQTCSRVAVMYAGEIVELADKEELFESPRHPYTIGLMSSMPDLERASRELHPIGGMPPSLVGLPSGCRFAPRCPWAAPECAAEKVPLVEAGASGRLSRCIRQSAFEGATEFPERTVS
jgi:peptide/nickel transport system ATP-binding protein